uniref:Uncharacterized protein n=1 Tax=Rhizophora mucronata TaxID=61149 RepID=A0A2P2ITX4_RHIMU
MLCKVELFTDYLYLYNLTFFSLRELALLFELKPS